MSVRLTMFEPQPRFYLKLSRIAASWNEKHGAQSVRYVNGIAAAHDGNATFFLSRNSHAASTNLAAASRYGNKDRWGRSNVTVRAVSLSRILLEGWRRCGGRRPLVMLKVDIEGEELRLLQSLLVTGALCAVNMLAHSGPGALLRGPMKDLSGS